MTPTTFRFLKKGILRKKNVNTRKWAERDLNTYKKILPFLFSSERLVSLKIFLLKVSGKFFKK